MNSQIEVTDEGRIHCKLSVKLSFSMSFGYEDNEGDYFRLVEAELTALAIIFIEEEYIRNDESNCYRLISKKKLKPSDIYIENFTYNVDSITNLYDELRFITIHR